ncbi:MAG: chemotaxis protein CheX [Spirochaetes bacterium]|jgi:chemotaxis protein CheX|nr:chemotaxis protein CheX [Spirochaetota bacterium]
MKRSSGTDINLVNPLLISAGMVFNTLLNVELKKGEAEVVDRPNPAHDVVIRVEMSGRANGYVLYSLGFATIKKIVESMVPGISEDDLNSEYKDIMGEFANMITGNAASVLSGGGLEISTPVILHRNDIKEAVGGNRTVYVLKQNSPFGQLETTVVLRPAA